MQPNEIVPIEPKRRRLSLALGVLLALLIAIGSCYLAIDGPKDSNPTDSSTGKKPMH